MACWLSWLKASLRFAFHDPEPNDVWFLVVPSSNQHDVAWFYLFRKLLANCQVPSVFGPIPHERSLKGQGCLFPSGDSPVVRPYIGRDHPEIPVLLALFFHDVSRISRGACRPHNESALVLRKPQPLRSKEYHQQSLILRECEALLLYRWYCLHSMISNSPFQRGLVENQAGTDSTYDTASVLQEVPVNLVSAKNQRKSDTAVRGASSVIRFMFAI